MSVCVYVRQLSPLFLICVDKTHIEGPILPPIPIQNDFPNMSLFPFLSFLKITLLYIHFLLIFRFACETNCPKISHSTCARVCVKPNSTSNCCSPAFTYIFQFVVIKAHRLV